MKKILIVSLSLLCFGALTAQAQEAFPFLGKVTSKTANVRAGQNTSFESLGQVKAGDEIVVVGSSFDWRKIKLPAEAKAYVNAAFVKDLGDGTAQVTGNRLNIRAAALATASIIGQLKKGDLVHIVEKKDDWLRIEPPDQSFGWIAKDLVEFQSKEIPLPRAVKLPVPSIEVRKVTLISATGVVQDLGAQSVSADIRHSLQSDGKVYALQGYRHVIDGFFNQKVKIEGKLQPDIKSANPVLLVTKITLVL